MFTPWSLNVSPRMRRHLEGAGRFVPDGETAPSGVELIADLIEPLGALPEIRSRLTLQARVAEARRVLLDARPAVVPV